MRKRLYIYTDHYNLHNCICCRTDYRCCVEIVCGFYNLDDEIKTYYKTTLDAFVRKGTLEERDKKRIKILKRTLKKDEDFVMAMTVISYHFDEVEKLIEEFEVLPIQLVDHVESIYDRLVFSDENDEAAPDNEYRDERREHYLYEISEDLTWYSYVYRNIRNIIHMDGMGTEDVCDKIIEEYKL